MAKIKPSAPELSPQEKVATLIRKPETIVGAIVLGAVAVVASQAWKQDVKTLQSEVAASNQELVVPSEPQPVEESSVVEQTDESLSAIQVLADTSASQIVTAQTDDTFWNIARRYCGSGVQGYRIERDNGYTYKLLQPGDQIEVTCE